MRKKFNNIPKILILLVLLFGSRLLLLDGSADFFDATQYIRRVQEPFWHSLTSGHPPFHPLYIASGNIFYRILDFFGIHNAGIAASLPSAIFGSLTVIVFYLFIKEIFNRKIALLSSIFIAIIPFFWIASITVLVDPTGIFFLFLAIYLYWLGLKYQNIKKKIIFILLAGLFFGLALFIHTSFGMWIPIFFGLFLYKQIEDGFKLKDLLLSLFFIFGPLLIIAVYTFLLVHSGLFAGKKLALEYLLLGNVGDREIFTFLYFIKTITFLWRGSSSPIMILSFLGLLTLIWHKKKELVLIVFWLVPAFIVSGYVYENLHGRAMIPALFALSLLAVYFVYSIKKTWLKISLAIIGFALTLNVSLPAVFSYATQIAPNETLPEFEKKLPSDALLIGTNTMRTWNDDEAIGHYERFGDVDVGVGTVLADVEKYLKEKKPIYLSSDAIFFPYWRYDGQFFDIRSLNLGKGFAVTPLSSEFFGNGKFDLELSDPRIKKYVFRLTQKDDTTERLKTNLDNLPVEQSIIVGRLVDRENGSAIARSIVHLYPPNLHIIKENILSRDPFYRLYRYLCGINDPLIWGLTDNQGFFVLPFNESLKEEKVVIFNDSATTRVNNKDYFFVQRKKIDISDLLQKDIKKNLTREKLLEEIANLSNQHSFYIKKDKSESSLFTLVAFDYQAPKTNRIEAEDLASYTGKVVKDKNASFQKVRKASKGEKKGYLTAGPYLTLLPGSYQLKASIKIAKADPGVEAFGSMEVVGKKATTELGKTVIKKTDLRSYSDYQEIEINFNLNKAAADVEFRTVFNGQCDLYVDFFALRKVN